MTAITNIIGAVLLAALGVGMAAPASADPASAEDDTAGHVAMLELAGLIDHDGTACNMVNGCATANLMTARRPFPLERGFADRSRRDARGTLSCTS
jgi:hypothetical protein